jgi:membrane protein
MLQAFNHLRRAVWKALAHEVLTLSKSAAYSAILGLFPAILVGTTVLAMIPQTESVTGDLSSTLSDFLPTDMMNAIQVYFQAKHGRSVQVLISAIVVTIFGGMGVMTSFMEGFRRAYNLEKGGWSFWRERVVAIGLIPFCLVPLFFATLLVAFGHQIERWIVENSDHSFKHLVLIGWRMVRWAIALSTTALVLAMVYRYGTPRPRKWRSVVPGASGATVIWFLATLFFGWYVTRFADYTVVYGSLGTAIATLVWLYITCMSVFIGCELNAQVFPIEDWEPSHPRFAALNARPPETRAGNAANPIAPQEHSPTL